MTERIDKRSAYLLVAAGIADGMPVPHRFAFSGIDGDILSLDPYTVADGRAWLIWFGVPAERISISGPSLASGEYDGKSRIWLRSPSHNWRGWSILISLGEVVTEPPVESDAADKVRAAAAEVTP